MIRVAFRPIGGAAWQGGRNYLWNLLYAITAQSSPRIQPVLFTAPDESPGDLVMPGVEHVTTAKLLDSRRARLAGRLTKLATRRNLVERHWLKRAKIDVVSHATPVGGGIPTIAWVPDVQHRNLPDLTPRIDHYLIDHLFRELLRDAAVVLTSSEAARTDLQRFFAADPAKCRVLRFVSQPRLPRDRMIALADLRAKLGIPERYIHLPNQLWKHKNHALVIEALRLVPDVVIVATGPREDWRHAGIYDELMALVGAYGLRDRFLHLGLVSFPELISLMHHAVAVVNPSRFEGWSTTVEEAKSLGKQVLVSDIPVHREQAPERARYFPVDDAAVLARLLGEVWATHDLEADARAAAAAAAALPGRTRAFAETYESIVLDVVGKAR
jgi:glycosyltransferase involved in cell wall biosynthesis